MYTEEKGWVGEKIGELVNRMLLHAHIICGGTEIEEMDLRVLHQPVRADHARGEDGAGRLGGAIACADDGEDDGDGAAQGSEEGLGVEVSIKARHEVVLGD